MSVLDSTIVNVALPSMAHDFHTSDAASIWVINSYQVAILIALLPLASLREIVGYGGCRTGASAYSRLHRSHALWPLPSALSASRV